jgi:TPR repeat protein
MEGYLVAARAGNVEALYALGYGYQYGIRESVKDGTKAARWYRAAIDKGHARAMTALASMYLDGDGIPRNRSKGLYWLRRAIDLGEPIAMYTLGAMEMTGGDGVARDPVKALRLLRAAAAKGYPSWAEVSPGPRVSSITNRPEHVGQCFMTKVRGVGERFGELSDHIPREYVHPDDGSVIELADGHYNVAYDALPGIYRSRRGDAVRLCLIALPKDCPPGDTRGFNYRGLNLRTGLGWNAGDTQHLCGGA